MRSGIFGVAPRWPDPTQRRVGAGSGATHAVLRLAGAPSPLPALAVPHEGRGLLVPVPRRLLEPVTDLSSTLRLLSGERPALEKALDRLGHGQPTATQGRVERHNYYS